MTETMAEVHRLPRREEEKRPVRRVLQYPRQGWPWKCESEADWRFLLEVSLVALSNACKELRKHSELPAGSLQGWSLGKKGPWDFGSGENRNGL